MSQDLEINAETYDIVFIKNRKEKKSLEYKFVATNTNGLTFSFNIRNSRRFLPTKNSLEYKFEVKERQTIKADCNILDSTALLKQSAIIRLKTALGDLPLRKNIGSRLELLRHQEINNILIDKIKAYCVESLEDIIPNIDIEIKYDISIYSRNIIIIVKDGSTLLTRYKLEV